jgi:hypothetical protein
MMIRSMSNLDRQNSCNYVVIPPGMPLVATPARTPHRDNSCVPVNDSTIVTTGVLSSLLVFLMWVGAWGCVDTLIGMITDVPKYQLVMYFGCLTLAALGVWLQLADWRKSQEIDEDIQV